MNTFMCGNTPTQPFVVYEVEEEITWRKWRHLVQGVRTQQEAIDKVKEGRDLNPVDDGTYGEADCGRVGCSTKSYEDAAENIT
ncbi:MAG: hypothetical protein V3S43_06210 [Acidimicrobiia bacterium]